MKAMTILSSIVRAATLVSALALYGPAARAESPASNDMPAQVLAASGSIPVKDAGPYVHVGSYRIHVRMRLGRPTATLPDGTWFYKNFTADNSSASGTLVVRFGGNGRVSQLTLVTPAVALAMLHPAATQGGILVARH